MDLFNREEHLTEEAKADKEFKEKQNFLVNILLFVCKTPFKLVGLVIKIIYTGIFGSSEISKQTMRISDKKLAAEEFQAHENRLKEFGAKSLTEQEIIQITRKQYDR